MVLRLEPDCARAALPPLFRCRAQRVESREASPAQEHTRGRAELGCSTSCSTISLASTSLPVVSRRRPLCRRVGDRGITRVTVASAAEIVLLDLARWRRLWELNALRRITAVNACSGHRPRWGSDRRGYPALPGSALRSSRHGCARSQAVGPLRSPPSSNGCPLRGDEPAASWAASACVVVPDFGALDAAGWARGGTR